MAPTKPITEPLTWQRAFSTSPFSMDPVQDGHARGRIIRTLPELKDFLDRVHIRLCLLKPFCEHPDYPLVESRDLLPSFEPDLTEVITSPESETEAEVVTEEVKKVEEEKPVAVPVQEQAPQMAMLIEKSSGAAQQGGDTNELLAYKGTVRKALDLMEVERIVTRRQGRGTFVNDYASAETTFPFSMFHNSEGQRISGLKHGRSITREPAGAEEAARLGLRRGDEVVRIARLRTHQDQTFMTETCLLPAKFFPRLPEDRKSVV